MFKKVLKVVGIYAAIDMAFQMGKGFMLAHVRERYPEEGEAIHDEVVEEFSAENESLFVRVADAVILWAEDASSEFIHLAD